METSNYTLLRESLTPSILQKSTLSPSSATDLEDLSDFLDYLTQELYTFLPRPLQTATPLSTPTPPTPTTLQPLIPPLSTLPLSITESLINYDIVSDADDVEKLISHVLSEYIDAACAPPPEWAGAGTKKDACEICERVGVSITYHHLIPVCFDCAPGEEKGARKRRGGRCVDVWVIRGWMVEIYACKSTQEEVASGGYD